MLLCHLASLSAYLKGTLALVKTFLGNPISPLIQVGSVERDVL